MYPDGFATRSPDDMLTRLTWKLSSGAKFLWNRPPHSGYFLGCIRRLSQCIPITSFWMRRAYQTPSIKPGNREGKRTLHEPMARSQVFLKLRSHLDQLYCV